MRILANPEEFGGIVATAGCFGEKGYLHLGIKGRRAGENPGIRLGNTLRPKTDVVKWGKGKWLFLFADFWALVFEEFISHRDTKTPNDVYIRRCCKHLGRAARPVRHKK